VSMKKNAVVTYQVGLPLLGSPLASIPLSVDDCGHGQALVEFLALSLGLLASVRVFFASLLSSPSFCWVFYVIMGFSPSARGS
jgi:hypothetical protein